MDVYVTSSLSKREGHEMTLLISVSLERAGRAVQGSCNLKELYQRFWPAKLDRHFVPLWAKVTWRKRAIFLSLTDVYATSSVSKREGHNMNSLCVEFHLSESDVLLGQLVICTALRAVRLRHLTRHNLHEYCFSVCPTTPAHSDDYAYNQSHIAFPEWLRQSNLSGFMHACTLCCDH